MFIPVSTTLGDLSVTCVSTKTGTLLAECNVIYEGVDYPPLTEIEVKIHDQLQLVSTVEEDQDIAVAIDDEQFTWHIRKAEPTRFVEGFGHQEITGTVRAPLVFEDGTQVAVTAGDPFAGEGEILLHLDMSNSTLVAVNASTGAFKTVALGSRPVDFLVMPDPLMPLELETYIVVVTDTSIIGIDKNLEIFSSRVLEGLGNRTITGIGHISGDTFSVMTANNVWVRVETLYQTLSETHLGRLGNDVFGYTGSWLNLPSGEIYVAVGRGVALYNRRILGSDEVYWFLPEFTRSSRVTLAASENDPSIFAIDASTSVLHRFDRTKPVYTADASNTQGVYHHYLRHVPSDVLAVDTEEGVRAYVSYFDADVVEVYDAELNLVDTLDMGRAARLAMIDGKIVATMIYADAPEVTTTLEPSTETIPFVQQELSKTVEVVYQHTEPRALFAESLDERVVITVNGLPFTGFLPAQAEVKFVIPASDLYYKHRTFGLIGTMSIIVPVRVEPKLFSSLVTMTRIYDAEVRTDYIESFVVSDMTEGFEVSAESSTPLMLLSVNDGEFESSGTVKLGDTVTAKYNLPRMSSTFYTVNNNIVTEHGVTISTWPILKMELDGVEKEAPNRAEKIRNYDYMEYDSAHESPVPVIDRNVLQHGYAAKLESGEAYGSPVQAQSELTYAAETNARSSEHTLDQAMYVYADAVQVDLSQGQAQCSANFHSDGYGDGAVRRPVAYAMRDLSYDYEASSVFKSIHTLQYYVVREVSREGVSVVLTASIQVPPASAYVDHNWVPVYHNAWYDIAPDYDLSVSVHSKPIAPDYDLSVSAHSKPIAPDYERNVLAHREPISPTYMHNFGTLRNAVAIGSAVQEATSKVELDILYGSVRYTAKTEVEFDYEMVHNRITRVISADYELVLTADSYAVDLEGLFRTAANTSTVATVGDVYGSRNAQSVETEGSVQVAAARHVTECEGVLAQGTVRKVVDVQVVFAESHYRSVTLGEDGLFESMAVAKQYADSINLDDPFAFEQVNGNWQLRSNPVVVDKECIAGQLELPDKMFGYLGGG